jgi:hypothetical protein
MKACRLAVVAACALGALAGCGGSDDQPADKTGPFVGTWTATGAQMGTCPAPIGSFNQPIDNVVQTISKGTDSDLSMTLFMGCTVKLDVTGTVATIRPGQACSLMVMGVTAMGAINTGTFTVTGDTASFNYAGTGGLGPIMCTFSASGTSKKGAATDAGAGSSTDGP